MLSERANRENTSQTNSFATSYQALDQTRLVEGRFGIGRAGNGGDATGNGGYLAEAARLRWGASMIECVMLNDPWYREWMPKLKVEFEDDTLVIPRHADVVDDLGKIQVINGVPKIDKGRSTDASGQKRHGDFAVALAMAIRASWMEGGAIDFTPLPGKSPEASPHNPMQPDNSDDDYHRFERGAW